MSATIRSIYCSGSIIKGAADEKRLCWTDRERTQVADGSASKVVFLNPDDPITDPGNTLGQFGRDMYQIMVASAVVVDARERRGLGIGVEMAAAAALGTPVIVVAPRNGKYRMDSLDYRGVTIAEYVHPHVASLAAAVVETFEEAGRALDAIGVNAARRELVPDWLEPGIGEYETNVLPGDQPMVDALAQLDSTRGDE
jgi:glycosyltransferase involved in cell wall biosynthesis